MPLVATAALVTMLAAASWFDVRERRIPNAVTASGLGAALVLRAMVGVGAILDGLLGAGLALLFALLPFAFGVLGGGDAKLLAAVGGFMGPGRLIGAFLVIAVLGGALALFEAARQRRLVRALTGTFGFLKQWVLFGRAGVAPAVEAPGRLTVPYGIAIAAGALAWWFLAGAEL